jgi:hypothetical protein
MAFAVPAVDCVPAPALFGTVVGSDEEWPPQAASDSVSTSADAIARVELSI